MSGTLNKVMLIGHLGDEVKMHYFDDKNCVGRFPLATNETYTNKQTNERVSNTEWHNIVVRNKAAEICEKYLSKGDKVYIEGRIKTRKWTDDKGTERYSTEIQCSDFTFLTNKNEQQNSTPQQNTPQTQPTSSDIASNDNDDLPF
ncbi:single-stranded DNA-binding protein [Winogradskyella immobilis]|uniref:Single-stranded DNA-binding protein n=1 Tax=Winogradskyella immobilis TaxID=2816852 RepID=A0ABS8EIH9_9FLAO|nr:single-stranded DNA-binding protein [Winogradskyella immobilis]MCC1482968.1 single-stranded DNA-binding protein [Winogradskyella immobilis]MCG0015063.1 single-stranded DNA-binding protein [Winogradskyella immobilis]